MTNELKFFLVELCGVSLLPAFPALFYNIVMSVGLNGVIGIFTPSKLDKNLLVPEKE